MKAIPDQPVPVTVESLVSDLQQLGVKRGMTLLVHSSLSSMGWVCGGAQAVIMALEATLGQDGTLVMPTHSSDFSDPAAWSNPPVPESWWRAIRETMPAFDIDLSRTTGMGVIPESFRRQAGAERSDHPQVSFCARGSRSASVVGDHPLAYGLGERSPLARIYDLDGWVLLIGVGHDSNTSIHLAEYRAAFAGKREIQQGAPVIVDGARAWVTFPDVDVDEEDFPRIGSDFADESGLVISGAVAGAAAMLMPQRPLVDYAVTWMNAHR